MRGTEGEAFANPKRRPQIEYFHGGETEVLFEAEHGVIKNLPHIPEECDAKTTAQWIREARSEGEHPVPLPLINQFACCIYAAGYTHGLHPGQGDRRGEGAPAAGCIGSPVGFGPALALTGIFLLKAWCVEHR